MENEKMSDDVKYPVLSKINVPEDIRKLDPQELKTLCKDIREFLIDTISEIGGHFGGGLGAVELAVAVPAWDQSPELAEERCRRQAGHERGHDVL